MKTFMDVHTVSGATEADVAKAHLEDLKVMQKHGVEIVKYWMDQKSGKVFCLSHAPSKEAHIAVHREAHGLLPDDVFEVTEHT